MPYKHVKILDNKQIAPEIFAMTVPCEDAVKPGQFFMLRRPDAAVLLPRAISVCDWEQGQLLFLYQRVGRGTSELSGLRTGDELCITGPLGNGFDLSGVTGKIALVGGGIGIAPMLYTARKLRERGIQADCYAGFRDEPYLLEQLEPWVNSMHVATESGKIGHKGFVTALLRPEAYDIVLCCGPEPMMRATVALCKTTSTPIYVSMENKMACGLGACLVCTCTGIDGKNRRTCKDGPVFRGEEIDFEA